MDRNEYKVRKVSGDDMPPEVKSVIERYRQACRRCAEDPALLDKILRILIPGKKRRR